MGAGKEPSRPILGWWFLSLKLASRGNKSCDFSSNKQNVSQSRLHLQLRPSKNPDEEQKMTSSHSSLTFHFLYLL